MTVPNTFVVASNVIGTISTGPYSVTLGGPITGSGGLNKTDSGTLILASSNSYSGVTSVSQGTLQLASAAGLSGSTFDTSGAGSLSFGTLTSATLGGLQGSGSLTLNNTSSGSVALAVGSNNQDTTYSGSLNGSGSLVKVGSGTLNLTGSGSWTGGLVIDPGIVAIGSDAALGAVPASPSTNIAFVANGALRALSSLTLAANRNITVAAGSAATFDPCGNTLTIGGAISGGGALAVAGSGTLVLAGSNSYSGGTFVECGALEATTTGALPAHPR